MRVLMFGWEFPPYKSGGLGTACYGMGRALAKKGTEILFVLPQTLGRPGAVGNACRCSQTARGWSGRPGTSDQ
ncbi:MAG: glycogen/starch synthase [Bilophila wadsworthia]